MRVGIIGCGGIARFHVAGYQAAGVEIAAVCDVDADRGRQVAAGLGAEYVADFRRLVKRPDLEAVSICSPTPAHLEQCLAAIAAGKAVLCEKTMTGSAREAEQVLAAAREAGTIFQVAYMKRFLPAAVRAREEVARLGPVFSIQARSFQPGRGIEDSDMWRPGADGKPSWVKAMAGAGALATNGSHIIDLIHGLVGHPCGVCATVHGPADYDVEIDAHLLMEYPDFTAHLEASFHPYLKTGANRDGWDEWIQVNGRGGRVELFTVQWNEPEKAGAILRVYEVATDAETCYVFDRANGFDLEVAAFVASVSGGAAASPDAFDGYAVDVIIDAAYQAAASGCRQAIRLSRE